MKSFKLASLALAGAIGLSACTDDAPTTLTAPDAPALAKSAKASADNIHVIVASGSDLPPGLAKKIEAAGGTLVSTTPEIGTAVAVSADPKFAQLAARIAGGQSVAPDVVLQWIDSTVGKLIPLEIPENPPASGSDDFFNLQWESRCDRRAGGLAGHG